MRRVGYEDLDDLCRSIKRSFVHLETRDAYGTEVELPHMAQWRRGEPDDLGWLGWWLDMLRGHRAAGRSCRRARVVSEPLSDYQRWTMSHARVFLEAGEDIRYVARPRLTDVFLPGSGDFYVFDEETVLYLHYAGDGMNASFEVTDDSSAVRACADAFEDVWKLTTPLLEYRSQ
jgi:hypothetical protein